jgi:flagellar protein FlbD
MIIVTRFNGTPLYINPDLILHVEQTPDTVITMTNGEKLIVKDKADDVVAMFMDYKRAVSAGPQERVRQ